MTTSELDREIQKTEEIIRTSNSSVKVSVDGYSFDAHSVSDYGESIVISTNDRFPYEAYRFTFLMFEPETDKFIGITHRTYRGVSDSKIIETREKYIPGYQDTKYRILRIERVLDDSADIYKQVWEYDE